MELPRSPSRPIRLLIDLFRLSYAGNEPGLVPMLTFPLRDVPG